jgi:hypothetical protein
MLRTCLKIEHIQWQCDALTNTCIQFHAQIKKFLIAATEAMNETLLFLLLFVYNDRLEVCGITMGGLEHTIKNRKDWTGGIMINYQ